MDSSITVTQMQYILAVSKEGNFRRAAQSCHVSQPTLSVQIQKFEELLGTPLFDRSKSPVQPTKIGKLVIEQIQIAFIETQKIMEVINNRIKKVEGELKIGVIPTISPYLVPLFLKDLNSSHPQLQLNLFEMTTENCLKSLDEEEIDVAILATKESTRKYIQRDLYKEAMLLFTNDQHPFFKQETISSDELKASELWLLEDGHCLRDEIIKVCQLSRSEKSKPGNLNLKIGNLESLRYLVEENFGYTLLPYLSTLKLSSNEKKLLRPFKSPTPFRTVNITTRKHYLKQVAIEALGTKIISNLPQSPYILTLQP